MEKQQQTEPQEEEDDGFEANVENCSKIVVEEIKVQEQPTPVQTIPVNASNPVSTGNALDDLGSLPMDDEHGDGGGASDMPGLAEMQKMFTELLNEMGGPSAQTSGAESELNPMLSAFDTMFKNFDKVIQPAAPSSSEGAAPGLAGIEGMDDPMLQNLLKGLMGGEGEGGDAGMEKIMGMFNTFLKDSESNPEIKNALNEVIGEFISKDTMYEPMKQLRDEFPPWLEENWQSLSQTDLEMYNNQHDKITEICTFFETKTDQTSDSQMHELLSQLQDLGSPPPSLLKRIEQKVAASK